MRGTIDRAELVRRLLEQMPAMRTALADEGAAGLLHVEVALFAAYTQEQIDGGNRLELLRCYETARSLVLHGDDDVLHAMQVAYLANLDFRDGRQPRAWAAALLPEPLATERRRIARPEADD